MGMVTGLVALAICGSDPAPAAPAVVEPGYEITCQVEMMTIEGLGWRSAAYSRMKPAARQGAATIWTADRSLKATLEASSVGRSIKAPKVTTATDAVASVNSDVTQNYIRHVERVSDGPINGASQLAFKPEVATLCEGFSAQFAGRRFDQGVMAKVKINESHVGALHTLLLHEETKPVPVAFPASITPFDLARHIVQTIHLTKQLKWATTVQVPEVFTSKVEGEWFIPNDAILLISMGVNTVADAEGKAKVQERLAILDFARPCDEGCTVQASFTPACQDDLVAVTSAYPLSMPTVPDRSFPEAVDQDGQVFELPPLPEAYASADLNQINPGPPLASAQSAPKPRMISDPQLARTSLQAIPDDELEVSTSLLENYYLKLEAEAKASSKSGCATGITELDSRFCPVESDGLASMVEGFLRKGMNSSADQSTCDEPACPVEGCPFSVEGCDETKPSTQAANVEMGISVRDGQGLCVYNAEEDLFAALKNPGKTEVKYVPLGENLALEIQAKVVAKPGHTSSTEKLKPLKAPASESLPLKKSVDQLQNDSDQLSARFWFLDYPGHMTPGQPNNVQPAPKTFKEMSRQRSGNHGN